MKPSTTPGQANKPNRITDEQLTRVILAWRHLADNGNFIAQAISAALNGADPERQRQIVANATAEAYALMLSANMAVTSKRGADQVAAALGKVGKA